MSHSCAARYFAACLMISRPLAPHRSQWPALLHAGFWAGALAPAPALQRAPGRAEGSVHPSVHPVTEEQSDAHLGRSRLQRAPACESLTQLPAPLGKPQGTERYHSPRGSARCNVLTALVLPVASLT